MQPVPQSFQAFEHGLQQEVLSRLHGFEVRSWASTCKTLAALAEGEKLWEEFVQQEFLGKQCCCLGHAAGGALHAAAAYRQNLLIARCKAICWRRLPCQHQLGAREGSPGMFACRGYLFVYGGWGYGPEADLHVSPLSAPLALHQIPIAGNGMPPSYEMKVTLLEGAESIPTGGTQPALVAISGGYLRGGYHHESSYCGLLEITFPAPAASSEECHKQQMPKARWRSVTRMTPRSNHSATYVPARAAGPFYEQGYLMLFGGNSDGRVSNSVDVLDLSTFTWQFNKSTTGCQPPPRNSHSAVLMQTFVGERVVVAGGGSGDDSNAGPPRGGRDVSDVYLLDPQEFEWEIAEAVIARGRGHCTFQLGDSLLAFSGGKVPTLQMLKMSPCPGSRRVLQTEVQAVGSDLPEPRAFGGGCSLPDGSLVVFGGWHPYWGTYDDFWIGHVAGCETHYCTLLCGSGSSRINALERRFFKMFSALVRQPGIVLAIIALGVQIYSRCDFQQALFFGRPASAQATT